MIEEMDTLEKELYEEIINAYNQRLGYDLSQSPFAYYEIIKLMKMLREESNYDRKKLKNMVSNAIVLILSLFLQKDDDDKDNDGKILSKTEQQELREILLDVWDANTSGAEAF